MPSVKKQLISTGQVNLSNRLKKVVYKYDRQFDLPEFVFYEEAIVFVHKICRRRHINAKPVKTSYLSITCANHRNNKSEISRDNLFFTLKHIASFVG